MTKKLQAILILVGLLGVLTACSTPAEAPAIQPTEGKPTFVFFYTEN